MAVLGHAPQNVPLYPKRDIDQIQVIIKEKISPSKFINRLNFYKIKQTLNPSFFERHNNRKYTIISSDNFQNKTIITINARNFVFQI